MIQVTHAQVYTYIGERCEIIGEITLSRSGRGLTGAEITRARSSYIYLYISQALKSHLWLKLLLTSVMLGSHTQISDLWVKGVDLTNDSPLRGNVHLSTNGLNTSSDTKLSRSGSIKDINVLPVMLNSPSGVSRWPKRAASIIY